MKNILLASFFILTFFTACGQPDKIAFYKQDANLSHYPHAWQHLLLLSDEFLPQGSVKHFQHPPYLSDYLSKNPGFVDMRKFKEDFPTHELSPLLLWYSASFFYDRHITHYMVMEFPDIDRAKAYVTYLKASSEEKINRIYRYKTILFSFAQRDFNNELVDQKDDTHTQQWIDLTLKRIMEHL